MFDFCSDRLLECEDRFAERNGHRFLEIWDCGVRRDQADLRILIANAYIE